jgi:hypothetical protein
MLPIPKELQNQKAIPFMEWCNNAIILYRETYGNDNEIDIFKIKRILDFYNQPFTPEMLQEYFEGLLVERCETGGVFFTKKVKEKSIFINSFAFDLVNEDYLFYSPKSLNDFTTLCNLAGINLKWKGETE